MADYRDWCGSCGNEINFGGHDKDCEAMFAQRIAMKEERDHENAVREEYRSKSQEEIRAEWLQLATEVRLLDNGVRARERKLRLIQDYIDDRMGFYKELRDSGLSWVR